MNASAWQKDLGPYPGGSAWSMVDYGNQNRICRNASMTLFMQYLPFLMLVQAMLIILVKKFLTKFPKISGKVERFYYTVVENSLFGKDPDIAEDICDEKSNAEAISRHRQRNEVCNSLKKSNIIHFIYVLRNIIELILLTGFIPFNIYFSLQAEGNLLPAVCILPMYPDSALGYSDGEIHYQCEGKRIVFFFFIVCLTVALQIACLVCSTGSLIWCLFFRSISNLLKSMEEVSSAKDFIIQFREGRDFIFLFDLLAHTSGIESTLRLLTHSDETFYNICQPRLKSSEHNFVQIQEDKMKVVWQAARIEKWLKSNINNLFVDSYDVTIFPAETSRHTITKMAKQEEDLENDDYYSAVFNDLNGGKTEYIITIACVIGKSRMKGQRIITTLLPLGPETPRTGIVKSCNTTEIEITWDHPRGEFSKYLLLVDPCLSSISAAIQKLRKISIISSMSEMTITTNASSYDNDSTKDIFHENSFLSKDSWSKELSNKESCFTITGLNPGEPYLIKLISKTGDNETRKPLCGLVMTNPEPVKGLSIVSTSVKSVLISWEAPNGHSQLHAFKVSCVSRDGQIKKEVEIEHERGRIENTLLIDNLIHATEFTISLTTVCLYEKMTTFSIPETLQFITKPVAPHHLRMENQQCHSFTITWESPLFLG